MRPVRQLGGAYDLGTRRFSRPGDPLVRLSGPIGRGFQKGGTGGYLGALKRFVDRDRN